jgi:hypothetical protein
MGTLRRSNSRRRPEAPLRAGRTQREPPLELSKTADGTMLYFIHGNWRPPMEYFAMCNSTWGELMYPLKSYLEGRRPGPHGTA